MSMNRGHSKCSDTMAKVSVKLRGEHLVTNSVYLATELADRNLCFISNSSSATNVTMEAGDMVLYESHSVVSKNGLFFL